jgi:hypothetical protein
MNTAQIDQKLIPTEQKMHSLAGQKCVILGGRVHGAVGQHDIPKAHLISEVRCCVFEITGASHQTRKR